MAEPDWLAAEPTDRAKLTAIIAALRRCYAECGGHGHAPGSPHITTTMAELFIGQIMITADERIRASERERIRLAVFACRECGKVHEYRQTGTFTWTWGAGGHSCQPAHVWARGGMESLLAGVLYGEGKQA
jgi:hypothetical protein